MRVRFPFLTFVALALSACSHVRMVHEHQPDRGALPRTLRLWIEADPRVPRQAVMAGCNRWRAERITCVPALNRAASDIRVFADDGPCQGFRPRLAWSYRGGEIRLMMACLPRDGSHYDAHVILGVVVHEVGHQLGIWWHVPVACDDPEVKTHPGDGLKLCGRAAMNPNADTEADVVTDLDALAFDLRDPEASVLPR